MTTSAASQNVKRLEEALERQLLTRDGNRVRLSEAGARLAARLGPAFVRIEDAVAPFEPRPAGYVTILAPKAFGRSVISPKLDELNRASPHRAWLIWDARDHDPIDIEIVRATEAPMDLALEVGRDAIMVVCASDYRPRSDGATVESATLFSGPWSRNLWGLWLDQANAPRLISPQVVAAPTEAACLDAARLGLGFALARSSDAAGWMTQRKLIAPLEAQLDASDRYWAIARSRTASTHHVFNWLRRRFCTPALVAPPPAALA